VSPYYQIKGKTKAVRRTVIALERTGSVITRDGEDTYVMVGKTHEGGVLKQNGKYGAKLVKVDRIGKEDTVVVSGSRALESVQLCSVCSKTFVDEAALLKHQAEEHSRPTQPSSLANSSWLSRAMKWAGWYKLTDAERSDIQLTKLVALRMDGAPYSEIAKELGFPKNQTVSNRVFELKTRTKEDFPRLSSQPYTKPKAVTEKATEKAADELFRAHLVAEGKLAQVVAPPRRKPSVLRSIGAMREAISNLLTEVGVLESELNDVESRIKPFYEEGE
jgi:hypothetical protein